jgi:cytochrome c oxidase accessory protein FixG
MVLMSGPLLQPEEHVLSTLERDGSRRWLKPKLSKGRLLVARRIVAWLLIAVFTLIPFLRLNGHPLVLLNVPGRRFTIFGYTFLPTDAVLLAVFAVGILLSIFLFTALFGRVWCGWGCPQTVYMEFVFRPIERFFDGTVGRGGPRKNRAAWRTLAKYAAYFVVCVYLANTFLAYFVGVDELWKWVNQSPFKHPTPFLVMAFVTGAMMFDFCFFREQTCLIACPYGRFQSVLLDQNSLIVSYDKTRGEPRGKKRKNASNDLPVLGDCVDCGNCVTTCPTGIDIRDGLQMECINCTQCIDACNDVMDKLGRAPNLIRYSSQLNDTGKPASLLRPRTFIYPLLLTGIATLFFSLLLAKKSFDATLMQERLGATTMTVTESGDIQNRLVLKLTNRTETPMTLTVAMETPAGSRIEVAEEALVLEANEMREFHVRILAPRSSFKVGKSYGRLNIENDQGETRDLKVTLFGPLGSGRTSRSGEPVESDEADDDE